MNEEKTHGTMAQQIADAEQFKEQLSKDMNELHNKIFGLWGAYQYKETQEEFLILDKLYRDFLKAQRKLLNIGSIELNTDKKGGLENGN